MLLINTILVIGFIQAGRGHCTVYFHSPQSFIILTTLEILIGWLIKLSLKMFSSLTVINWRGDFVCHYLGCTTIYWPLSYPFRSLWFYLFSFYPLISLVMHQLNLNNPFSSNYLSLYLSIFLSIAMFIYFYLHRVINTVYLNMSFLFDTQCSIWIILFHPTIFYQSL